MAKKVVMEEPEKMSSRDSQNVAMAALVKKKKYSMESEQDKLRNEQQRSAIDSHLSNVEAIKNKNEKMSEQTIINAEAKEREEKSEQIRSEAITFRRVISGYDPNEVMKHISAQEKNFKNTCAMYDKKIESFKSTISMLDFEKEKSTEKIEQLNDTVEKLQNRLNEILSLSPEAFSEIKNNDESAEFPDAVKLQIQAATKEYSVQLEKSKEEIARVSSQLEESKRIASVLKQENIEQAQLFEQGKSSLEAKISKLTDLQSELNSEIEQQKAQLDSYKSSIADMQKSLDEKNAQYDNLLKSGGSNEETRQLIENLEAANDDLKKQLESSKELLASMQNGSEDISGLTAQLMLKDDEIQQKNEQISSLSTKVSMLSKVKDSLQAMYADVEKLKKSERNYKESCEASQQKIDELKKNIDDTNANYEKQISDLNQKFSDEKEKLSAEISAKTESLNNANAEIAKLDERLNISEKKLEASEARCNELTECVRIQNTTLEKRNKKIEELSSQLASAEYSDIGLGMSSDDDDISKKLEAMMNGLSSSLMNDDSDSEQTEKTASDTVDSSKKNIVAGIPAAIMGDKKRS